MMDWKSLSWPEIEIHDVDAVLYTEGGADDAPNGSKDGAARYHCGSRLSMPYGLGVITGAHIKYGDIGRYVIHKLHCIIVSQF